MVLGWFTGSSGGHHTTDSKDCNKRAFSPLIRNSEPPFMWSADGTLSHPRPDLDRAISEPRSNLEIHNQDPQLRAPQTKESELKSEIPKGKQTKPSDQEHRDTSRVVNELNLSLRKKDDEIEQLRHHFHNLSNEHESQGTKLQNLQAMMFGTEGEMRQLRASLAASQLQLSDCRDDLYRLQPTTQIPDSSILADFESLCQLITGWIEGEISRFERAHKPVSSDIIFAPGLYKHAIRYMQTCPHLGEYIVRYTIHRQLRNKMFNDEVYLLGLTEADKILLRSAEEGMATLQPRKDEATIRAWRSDTLMALAMTDRCADKYTWEGKKTTQDIFRILGSVFPIVKDKYDCLNRFYKQVFLPASDLARKIQTSRTLYHFILPDEPFLIPNLGYFDIDMLDGHMLVDVETRKTLKHKSAKVAGRTGVIGKVIMPVEPRIMREDGERRTTELRQMLLVAKIDA